MPVTRDGDYLPKGGSDIGNALTVATRDGCQTVRPMGGGRLEPLPRDFARTHEALTPERRAALLDRFEPALVTDDWLGSEDPIHCLSNGAQWNGHAMPLFEGEVVDGVLIPALAAGGATLVHAPDIDAYVEVDIRGERPWGFDVDEIRRRAASGETEFVMTDPEGVAHETGLRVYAGEDVTLADGSRRHGYGIGAGCWTWSVAEPSPSNRL